VNERAEDLRGSEASSGKSAWVRLLGWATIAAIVVVVLVNLFAGIIPPLVVFALLWIGAFIWLRRSTRGPAILLLVTFVAYILLSAPFIIPTLTVPASAGDFILNLGSLIAVLVGIVAAIAVLRRSPAVSGTARSIGLAAVALFIVGAVFSVVATVTREDAVAQEGDVRVVAEDILFRETSLDAGAGEVSVFVDNKDTTLHTFTIDELDVDLDIPASATSRVTFEAEPGTYRFYCVPHEPTMKVTLTVE
jgi:plastocyanin